MTSRPNPVPDLNPNGSGVPLPALSFEFFPARSPRMDRNLWRTMGQLELFNPAFFSMTYGALGSEREHSISAVESLQQDGPVPVAAHITAAGHTRESLLALAERFAALGARRLVALRGDDLAQGGFRDVADMVESLLGVADFDISVAAYPEVHPKALSPEADLVSLKRKLDAGSRRALTQYFFDAEVFLRFRDAALKAGITRPLVPGILPLHDFDKVQGFSARCGASVPDFLHERFRGTRAGSAEQREIGIDIITGLCENLIREGVEQLHFYTLNQPNLSYEIVRRLQYPLRHEPARNRLSKAA